MRLTQTIGGEPRMLGWFGKISRGGDEIVQGPVLDLKADRMPCVVAEASNELGDDLILERSAALLADLVRPADEAEQRGGRSMRAAMIVRFHQWPNAAGDAAR